jgi:hypothetical protein
LTLRTGLRTIRKDKYNGGTDMIACLLRRGNSIPLTRTFTVEGCQEILLYPADPEVGKFSTRDSPVLVEITLIDWASIFEIESFLVQSAADILPLHSPEPTTRALSMLVVGDSISCGYTDGSAPIPLGCLDAFPFVSKVRMAQEHKVHVTVELVAFPSITLVDMVGETTADASQASGLGMVSKFSHVS